MQTIEPSNIGIIIACYPGDLIWAKGCIGSLKISHNTLPICLIFDGYSRDHKIVRKLLSENYVQYIIDRENVKDPWLAQHSFGWGLTKMIAFWESPWEYFIYLDADIAVNGDLKQLFADYQEYDMILDGVPHERTPESIDKWFFETDSIGKFYPEFDWRKYSKYFFCTGTFLGKRNCLDKDLYQDAIQIQELNPRQFKDGEMGMLNFIIFYSIQQGKITAKHFHYQLVTVDYDQQDLFNKLTGGMTWIFHYAGAKPLMSSPQFNEPMTMGRKYLAQKIQTNLAWEDYLFRLDYFVFRAKKRIVREVRNMAYRFSFLRSSQENN